MKNWFSLKLYLEGLKKIKTPGIASAITVIALNAILPIVGIIESNMSWPGQVRVTSTVAVAGFAPFNLLMMVFGAILVYSMFSFLNERNKCDFWHAVPHKRSCVYFSFTAAVWTWIFGIILTSSLINLILWAVAKYYVVSASTVFTSMGVYFLVSVMIAAFMTLAMTITGTTISNLLITALLMLFVRVMGAIFVMGLEELAPMLDINYSLWRILEFDFCLPIALLSNLFSSKVGPFGDATLLLYSAVVTLLLVVAGAIGYHVRKSETATKSAPNKLLQHIYRCAVTLPLVFFLVALIITDDAEVITTVILLIAAVLVWVLFELLTTKKFKNVIKSLPVIVVPVLISLLLSGVLFLARNAVWNVTPEADEIEGISIGTSYYRTKTYEQLQIGELVVGNDTLNTIVADSLQKTVDDFKEYDASYVRNSRHLIIHLKSGRTIGRYVSMDDKEYQMVQDGFYSSAEYRKALLSLPASHQIDSISFTNLNVGTNAEKRLWANFLYEYNMLDDDEKRVIKRYNTDGYAELADKYDVNDDGVFCTVGSVYINGTERLQPFSSSYPILYQYMPETAKLYLELYNETNYTLAKGADKEIEKLFELAKKGVADPRANLYGGVYLDPLYGNRAIGRIDMDFYSKDDEFQQMFLDILQALDQLSDPENYECEKGRTIVFLRVNIEVNGSFLEENLSDTEHSMKFEPGLSYYYHMEIPLALTETEVDRILQIYEEYTVEKMPVDE